MNVAIQGILGSYHHQVAEELFGQQINVLECQNFSDIPIALQNNVDLAVMAIENTIAGAILPNYVLIDEYNLQIVSEYYLSIQHQLMALKNQTLADIHEVWSHPMALEQCRKFFRDYPHIKLMEDKDTALVAQKIANQQLIGIAAIASKKAAELFKLNILADNIQTHATNFTRFFVLTNQKLSESTSYNKASVKFTVAHQEGSLLHVLEIFKKNHLNLTKIQSLPIIEKPWEYAFFADMIFDLPEYFDKAIQQVQPYIHEIKVFGKYNDNNPVRL